MAKNFEREEQPDKAAKRAKFQHEVDEERMSDDVDTLLKGIALDISNNEDIENLGKQLGFTLGEIQNFIKTNNRYHEVTSDGTVSMLRKWSQRVSSSSLRSDLREALMRAKLVRIAETHLPSDSSGTSSSVPASKGSTNDRVQQIKKELREHYDNMYSSVRTSPLYSKSSMKLEEIYTNLVMLSNDKSDEGIDINYDNFIEHLEQIGTKRGIRKRIAISGEAGVGKTTFLTKLALDWALGRCLQTIDLLFLIHLREIEESTCFSHSIMNNLSDDLNCDWVELDEYIRTNQQKVMILYDGLDEYGQDISVKASRDATPAVIKCEKFKSSRVIVTTRPWKADRIRSDEKLKKQYTFVKIEGFKPGDVSCYISKFFQNNEEARESLTRLMTEKDSLVAQNMAPYPIYCSMLCFIWQNEGSRSVIQELKTFSKLFDQLILLLKEHYAGKVTVQEDQQKKLEQGNVCLQNFGKDALYSLLRNELVFRGKDLIASEDDLQTACDIGVLTREKRFVSSWENNKRKTELVVEYRIPHKLFHEYLAGIHLAWLYENNLEEFNQLTKQLIDDYQLYRYLLYFTAAQGLDVGTAVLGFLCEMLNVEDNDELLFVINVAFECNYLDAAKPLILHLNTLSSLQIRGSDHTTSGWMYVLQACSYSASERSDKCDIADKDDSPASSARLAGRGICSLSNLMSMGLGDVQLHDAFYTGMASLASQSKLLAIPFVSPFVIVSHINLLYHP
ncbi:NACHT, LRR and PYD domains-containing protein 1 homolog [Diadema antillarum]|uniref:NACHT, LRR and PYD domains-containing protein 1 homolog n=1 Tax=Diadema antillarum TaxID=105358 RepID=UPI003A85A37D